MPTKKYKVEHFDTVNRALDVAQQALYCLACKTPDAQQHFQDGPRQSDPVLLISLYLRERHSMGGLVIVRGRDLVRETTEDEALRTWPADSPWTRALREVTAKADAAILARRRGEATDYRDAVIDPRD